MGYGFGRDHVDVSIDIDTNLEGFAERVGSLVARLLLGGCRRFKLEVHGRGAILTGDQPTEPAEAAETDWKKSMREVLRGDQR